MWSVGGKWFPLKYLKSEKGDFFFRVFGMWGCIFLFSFTCPVQSFCFLGALRWVWVQGVWWTQRGLGDSQRHCPKQKLFKIYQWNPFTFGPEQVFHSFLILLIDPMLQNKQNKQVFKAKEYISTRKRGLVSAMCQGILCILGVQHCCYFSFSSLLFNICLKFKFVFSWYIKI